MLALLLVLCSTFSEEISQSIGKDAVKRRRETVYGLIFLELFWGWVVMAGIVIFSHGNRFSFDSLPLLIPRIIIEILTAYFGAKAIAAADRSTIGFLRLLSIPLLLVVDIILGYHLTTLQIAGVLIMFLALTIAFHHNPTGKRGAWLVVLTSLTAVASVSLFKYDITHYNSVAVEQVIVVGCVIAFFFAMSRRAGSRHSPLRLLVRPVTGTQALASGLALTLASYALGFAPASFVIALKRTFALMWAVLFGQAYFHEHSLKRKVYSFGFTTVGIFLLVSPYWFH